MNTSNTITLLIYAVGLWLLSLKSAHAFCQPSNATPTNPCAIPEAICRDSLRPNQAGAPTRHKPHASHEQQEWVYYGYRFQNASTGRWLSRDPISEKGGANLYSFLGNQALSKTDPLGMCCRCKHLNVTYNPGGDRVDFGPYDYYGELPVGPYMFGSLIHVHWDVDGDPNECTYVQDETKTRFALWDADDGHLLRTFFGHYNYMRQDYDDPMGFDINFPTAYIFRGEWNVNFVCYSSPPDRSPPIIQRRDAVTFYVTFP